MVLISLSMEMSRLVRRNHKPTAASGTSRDPEMSFDSTKIQEKFDGNRLKQEKIYFNHKNVKKLYILYDINLWSHDLGID